AASGSATSGVASSGVAGCGVAFSARASAVSTGSGSEDVGCSIAALVLVYETTDNKRQILSHFETLLANRAFLNAGKVWFTAQYLDRTRKSRVRRAARRSGSASSAQQLAPPPPRQVTRSVS